MIINKIEIESRAILEKQKVVFENPLAAYPFGAQVTALIGPNGCGKTTFCSTIVDIFQSACTGRKLDFNWRIDYTISDFDVAICNHEGIIKYYINDEQKLEVDSNIRNSATRIAIIKDAMEQLWNGNLILSTFETRGEYRNSREFGYAGYDPIEKMNVASIYGKDLRSFPSISDGFVRYLTDFRIRKIVKTGFDSIGLKYTDMIEVNASQKFYRILTNEPNEDDLNGVSHTDREFFDFLRQIDIKRIDEAFYIDQKIFSLIARRFPGVIGKYIYINGMIFTKTKNACNFQGLSAGEEVFVVRLFSIIAKIKKHSIIVIEEPECHLNPLWREIFIPLVHDIANFFDAVIFFTTHDYKMVRSLSNPFVYTIQNGYIKMLKVKTLLCDEYDFEQISGTSSNILFKKIVSDIDGKHGNKVNAEDIIKSVALVPDRLELKYRYLKNEKS